MAVYNKLVLSADVVLIAVVFAAVIAAHELRDRDHATASVDVAS